MRRPENICVASAYPRSAFSARTLMNCSVLVVFLLLNGVSFSVLASTVSLERQGELEHLLQQDCGSCHGLTLKGGLGSPLTVKALAGKSEHYLFAAIREGIPDTPMPPWSALLDDQEIHWLVNRLLNGAAQP